MNKTVSYQNRPEQSGRLYWLDRSGEMQRAELCGIMTVGRHSSQTAADIRLASIYVSLRHGEFACTDGICYYRDVGSGNGTWAGDVLLNGKATPAAVRLNDGDILRVGRTDMPDAPNNVLMLYTTRHVEEERWERFIPEANVLEFQVGRGRDSLRDGGIQLTDEAVSVCHCVFRRTPDGWEVENRSATNPILINGGCVPRPAGLRAKDVVRLANSYIIFDGAGFHILVGRDARTGDEGSKSLHGGEEAAVKPAATSLAIHIVRRSVKRRSESIDILRDIRLSVDCGEMVLILGGSGAGKTTFLNAVMGYEPAEGEVRFGETDLYREYDKMKYKIGYVPQEDLLRRSDRVIDTLDNAAIMKLPKSITEEERLRRVREMLSIFGLEREDEQLVSKLSGGQRKRLSIAVEYISDPTLFFLDEPDSGLDGVMARGLMQNLRNIADSGKIVMVITHSPDRVCDLFDKIIVLAKSPEDNCGHLAFCGSCPEALRFFGAESMEGVVRKINRPDEGGEGLADYFISKYAAVRGAQADG